MDTKKALEKSQCAGLSFIKGLLTCYYGIRSPGDKKQTGYNPFQDPSSGTRTCPSKGSERGPSEPDPCLADLSAFASSAGLNLQTWGEELLQKQTGLVTG